MQCEPPFLCIRAQPLAAMSFRRLCARASRPMSRIQLNSRTHIPHTAQQPASPSTHCNLRDAPFVSGNALYSPFFRACLSLLCLHISHAHSSDANPLSIVCCELCKRSGNQPLNHSPPLLFLGLVPTIVGSPFAEKIHSLFNAQLCASWSRIDADAIAKR